MWQTPNRSAATGTKKKNDRSQNRIPVHMKRIRGELKLLSSPATAAAIQIRVILNDLSPRGVGLFSQELLGVGQEIELVFEDSSMSIHLHGKIVWSREHQINSHILSQTPFAHRAGVQFVFKNAEEEGALLKFCEELLQT